jgi:hypothetical protein
MIDSHLCNLLPTVDGALTLAHLEYNLPERPGCNLGDMVELLAATGLLQKEEITEGHPPQQQQQQQPQQQPRYCVNTGLPRTQVTTPTTILQDILEAQDDWRASQQRQAKLQAALKDNTKPPRETLKAILLEFPDICQDPVYVAALRNLHVDVGLVATSFAIPTPKKKAKRRKPSTSTTGGGGGGGGKSRKATTSPRSTTATPVVAAASTATTIATAPAALDTATSSSSAAMPPSQPPVETTKPTATTTTSTATTSAAPAPATTSAPAPTPVATTATSS